jgi:hypothetical protein
MTRRDRFTEVVLDVTEVDDIGPAFADEIFRVFANEPPQVRITSLNANASVSRMIRRATANPEQGPGERASSGGIDGSDRR